MDDYAICYYCGKIITSVYDNNNADDWVNPDTVGKRCCGYCNDTIVIPHRLFSHYAKKGENNGHKSNT